MSGLSIITRFSKLSLQRILPSTKIATRTIRVDQPLFIHTSPCLLAEPLKKKKRVDPAIVKAREERKKKKIEKQIRRLERNARQLKPIEECEVPLSLLENRKERERSLPALSNEVREERTILEKQWAQYKHKLHLADIQMLDRVMYSQQKALDELRKESEELYQEAIQIDPLLLPFKMEGPTETPPIKEYESPDGMYEDISKKWN